MESSALSDTDTLTYTRAQRLQLQESYAENFRVYLPYLLRRMRMGVAEVAPDSASETTIAPAPAGVMARAVDDYDTKRTMVVAQALLGKTVVFGSVAQYERFRVAREGLPVLRVLVPYMSLFRRRVPFMVFERCDGAAGGASAGSAGGTAGADLADSAGAGAGAAGDPPFCTVHVRSTQHYRRFLLRFADGDTVAVFQHNFLPFADFCFRDTRFRVLGTSVAPYLMAPYSPQLRLLVVDSAQPALCDRLVPKLHQHAPWPAPSPAPAPGDDPVPHLSNPLVVEAAAARPSAMVPPRYIPNERPPFGLCMDACVYGGRRPLFRKYADAAQVVVYEARGGDTELLVLTAVLLALRENGLRSAVRYPNALGGGPGLLFSL